jgi:hypothetical protein
MAKIVFLTSVFVAGYIAGAWDSVEGIRIGQVAELIVLMLAWGAAGGIIGVLGYYLYLRPKEKRICSRERELEEAKSSFNCSIREFENYQKRVEIKQAESYEEMVRKNDKYLEELSYAVCRKAKIDQKRVIEDQIERKYRINMERRLGLKSQPEQEEKPLPKKQLQSVQAQTYQASNGKIYARLCEGEPVGKRQDL